MIVRTPRRHVWRSTTWGAPATERAGCFRTSPSSRARPSRGLQLRSSGKRISNKSYWKYSENGSSRLCVRHLFCEKGTLPKSHLCAWRFRTTALSCNFQTSTTYFSLHLVGCWRRGPLKGRSSGVRAVKRETRNIATRKTKHRDEKNKKNINRDEKKRETATRNTWEKREITTRKTRNTRNRDENNAKNGTSRREKREERVAAPRKRVFCIVCF